MAQKTDKGLKEPSPCLDVGSLQGGPETGKPEYSLRLWYMYRDEVCTVIDVDTRSRRVRIQNHTSDMLFRAFGRTENPSYEEYEAFLESRCFPRERDKMKLMLRELDIPFYDPFLIVEKTQGRMAEDEFWIRVEEMHGKAVRG